MNTTAYDTSVRFSEQSSSKKSLCPSDVAGRERLLQEIVFRDQVQAAILHLIRGYETTTGLSVTRLEYERREGRVMLEALPL
jgi:hypothetical protein